MQVREYRAASMKGALLRIKEDLGDGAVILKSRTVSGTSGHSMIEVTAAVDPDAPPQYHQPQGLARTRMDQIRQYREQENRPVGKAGNGGQPQGEELLQALEDHRRSSPVKEEGPMLGPGRGIPSTPSLSGPFRRMLDHLDRSGVDEEITSQLIDEMRGELQGTTLGDLERMEVLLTERIASRIGVSGPVRGRERRPVVVALVGPTGVGKTTTLAKLAANTKFMAEREVALISADTYRIAAVDQLRAFTRIADIPMEVVYAPLEMEQAVEKHRDKALVLIDTAGRSPWNTEQLLELKEYMVYAQPDEIHLVISLTSKESDVFDVVDRFGVVPIDRVLFTKLDETSTFGSMLNIVQRIGKPVSYVTNGQRVPEDIRLARSEELARLVLAGKPSTISDAGRWGTAQAPQMAWLKGSSSAGTLDG